MIRKSISIIILTIIGCCIFASCNKQKKQPSNEELTEIAEIKKKQYDELMNQAIEDAKSTLGEFNEALKKDHCTNRSLRVIFADSASKVDYVWIDSISFDGEQYACVTDTIISQYIPSLKVGDIIQIKPEFICDWMYIDQTDGTVHGRYTTDLVFLEKDNQIENK